MEWFVLTAVFTDRAYKICESGVSKKKKKVDSKIMQET